MIAARPRPLRRRLVQGAGLLVAVGVCAAGVVSAPASAFVDQLASSSDDAPRAFIGPTLVRAAAGPVVAAPEVAGPEVAAAAGTSTTVVADVPVRAAAFTDALPDERAAIAIRTAMAQLGLPYVWGGNGPSNGDAGFDCSGLTTFAYAAAGIELPRTAHTQYYAGPHVPAGAALQPGDLVFYGTPAFVHHVGLYLGDGKMVNAPTFGKPVQVAYYRYPGDDYIGATRPAATGSLSTGELPIAPVPEPVHPAAPETFPAPVAPAPTQVPDPLAPQPSEQQSQQEALDGQGVAVAGVESAPTTSTPAPGTSAPVYGPVVAGSETTTAPAPPASATTVPITVPPITVPPITVPPVTTVPPTTRAPTLPPSPTTVPPRTTVPTTTVPPAATVPATTPPPRTTTPAPAAGTTPATPAPKPAGATTLTMGGRTVALRSVKADERGIPVANGIRGHAVRLASVGAAAGSTLTLTTAGGAATTYTVASVTTMSTDAAAAAIAAGGLVVLAPAGAGTWTVAVAR